MHSNKRSRPSAARKCAPPQGLTLHPNMSERVRLLQMTLHWHMTGERHFKFLTGRDISPEPHTRQADRQHRPQARRSAATHSLSATVHSQRGREEGGRSGRWCRLTGALPGWNVTALGSTRRVFCATSDHACLSVTFKASVCRWPMPCLSNTGTHDLH